MEDWRIGGLRWGNDIVLLGLVFVEKNGVARKVPRYTRYSRYAASEVINSAKTTINSKSQPLYLLPPRNCTFAGRV